MDKQNTIEVDDNFGLMLNSALRYALGRRTYIIGATVDYIINCIDKLDTNTLFIMKQDIESNKHLGGGLGDKTIDEPYWNKLLNLLYKKLEERSKSGE